MLRPLFAIVLLVAAAMIAGVYFHFNPVILILVFLGFGLYRVTRIGGPDLPAGAPIILGGGHGIPLRAKDYVPDSDTSCGGADPRQGDGFR